MIIFESFQFFSATGIVNLFIPVPAQGREGRGCSPHIPYAANAVPVIACQV
jgi:hypothetical protein